jgi:hypothetical protein
MRCRAVDGSVSVAHLPARMVNDAATAQVG